MTNYYAALPTEEGGVNFLHFCGELFIYDHEESLVPIIEPWDAPLDSKGNAHPIVLDPCSVILERDADKVALVYSPRMFPLTVFAEEITRWLSEHPHWNAKNAFDNPGKAMLYIQGTKN